MGLVGRRMYFKADLSRSGSIPFIDMGTLVSVSVDGVTVAVEQDGEIGSHFISGESGRISSSDMRTSSNSNSSKRKMNNKQKT